MNDLCSVIQLLAALTIGFVILGHTKLFIDTLKKNYFKVGQIISEACGDFRKRLIPEGLVEKLKPMVINGKSTQGSIEKLKIDQERIRKRIEDDEEKWTKGVNDTELTRGLSSSCLFVFLVSVLLLFAPTARTMYGTAVELFLLLFCTLGIIYLIVGWIPLWEGQTLRQAVYWFLVFVVGSVVFSVAFSLLWNFDFGELWKYMFVIVVLFGWLNFIAHALIMIWRPMTKLKKEIAKEKKEIDRMCNESNEDYSFLIRIRDDFSDGGDGDSGNGWRTITPPPPTNPK